ncbi:triose-phosphate isomerase [Desulfurococcus amylolyticus]|uniref:Triosephosphate isomerase n=1 Tax=Desulfurococcus amylolyticus DSM 16532 TaxID=768672 RepID=I3XTE0_DESAM|nr:triose-phosphate isomerase [Desulfurococcus amylolyticus]AFL67214.1 triosephosphate isomerase [Desulfurococcus amylolyticus DSM 16532]
MVKPVLAVNFKAYYPHSFGENAYRLAKDAVRVWRETGVEVILAPPFTELKSVIEAVNGTGVKVFAQHADPVEPGAVTGFIPLEGLKNLGVHGVILNHSEHRLKISDINYLVKKARKLSIETLVCADTPETGAAVAVLGPDMVAVEPPELIGTGVSVSKAKPEVVTNSVDVIRRVNKDVAILTGAGITTGEDAYIAVKLGTIGVLVASGIVKAKDPYQVMKEMAEAMLKGLA